MKTIALADGDLSERESSLIAAAASALGVTGAIEPITPAALATELKDFRVQALQAAMLVAMIDGTVQSSELAALQEHAAALGVDDPRLANLAQLAKGHVRRMWLDLARRSFALPVFEDALKKRGLGGVLAIVAPMIGLGHDADKARRYNDLGRLDEGTLGRAYWRFVVDNDLGFPGEGLVAEEGTWHDVTHVLAGYDTSPEGEVSVVSFIAGYRKEDPFFWLFTIALQFHLGIRVSPYSAAGVGHFEPTLVLRALRRGMEMKRDLSVDYDPWEDFERPLVDLRQAYNVVP